MILLRLPDILIRMDASWVLKVTFQMRWQKCSVWSSTQQRWKC